ncbi:MAG: hypothetical protein K1X83_13415 [Oligoflexia bacterium]|nr:hypothetical protein [Oligoflexia bacterium]
MIKSNPDHHDAEIALKLYELRREDLMRKSRDIILGQFWPKNYDEFMAITDIKHPMNAAFRQVTSYWEMAYGFAKNGVVNPDFLIECNGGEGLLMFAKFKPYIEQFRREVAPTALQNTEWITQNSAVAKKRLELMESRVAKMLQTMKG